MKKKIFILFCFLLRSSFTMAQFNGAIGDGYADALLSSTTLNNTNLIVLYSGNNGDGYTNKTLSSTTLNNVDLSVLYIASNGDGYSDKLRATITLNNTQLTTLYSGGYGDGFNTKLLATTTLNNTNLVVMYSGNNGDGYTGKALDNTTLNNTSLMVMYSGSNEDGYAAKLVYATTLSNNDLTVLYDGGNGDGSAREQENVFLNPNLIVDLRLNIKVLLQGAIINPTTLGLMNDTLRENNVLPTTSPYADALAINPNVLNTGGLSGIGLPANDIVDWVWIEIRSALDNTNVVNSRSALLQRDGDVVGLDGTSDLIIEALTDTYFVIAKHRNHLGVMTNNIVSLNVAATPIDFTSNSLTTYGSHSQVQLSSGNRALWAGDTNNNGQIKFIGANNSVDVIKDYILADPSNFLNFITFSSTGYLNVDVDLNDLGKFSGANDDSNTIKDNILQHPANILNFPTFSINTTVPLEN